MNKNKIVAYLISEAETVSKPIIMNSGKADTAVIQVELQDADEFNRNKRNYGYDVLDDGLNKPNIKELIARKSWVGEAGHPMAATLQRQMSIDADRISHRILKWWWEGHKVKGIVETMNYGHGIQMRNYIRQGLETAFSLRAVGPVQKTGRGDIVQKPLTIQAYDWVFIPSHRQSYQEKIICGGEQTAKGALSEGYFVPVFRERALDYVKSESKDFKLIAECMDLSNGELCLNESMNKVIYTGQDKSKLCINVEDFIIKEINESFSKLI